MKEVVKYGEFKNTEGRSEPVEKEVVEAVEPTEEVENEESKDSKPVKIDYEADARAKGWKPKAEFEGDPEDWSPAKAWLKTGEILDSLHSIKRESKETKETIAKLAKHNEEIERKAYEKAYHDLEAKQLRAAEVGNLKEVKATTDQLIEMSSHIKAHKPYKNEVAEAGEKFISENGDWFNETTPENSAMKTYAVALENELMAKYPDLSVHKRLEMVSSDIKKSFSHRFSRDRPAQEVLAVQEASVRKPKADPFSQMPAHHQRIIKGLRRQLGAKFNEKEYIKNVYLTGELK